jgi:carbonic anhydrase/acetyltransferase-like protein (isoleucine patch superfamily)
MSLRSFGGAMPRIGSRVWLDPSAVIVGDVAIGDDASIWPFVAARGDVHSIAIGARSNVQDGTVLHVTHDGPYSPGGAALRIGEDVTVGHGAILHACTIGDRVLVGMGSRVLDEAAIEDDVMLAAGSLVSPRKRLRGGWLYRGSPAVAVRELTPKELEFLRYSAANYVRLKDRYLAEAAAAG